MASLVDLATRIGQEVKARIPRTEADARYPIKYGRITAATHGHVDQIREPGIYDVWWTADANNLGLPFGVAGQLTVESLNGYWVQIFEQWHTAGPVIAKRRGTATEWGGWIEGARATDLVPITNRLTALESRPVPETDSNPKILTDMTGWVAGPTDNATYSLAAADGVLGSTSVRITLDGTAGTGYVDKTGIPAFSLTGRALKIWVKLTNPESVASGLVKVSSTNGFTAVYGAALPITYGLKGPAKDGEWFPVVLSPGNFYVNNGAPNRESLVAIRIHMTGRAGMPAPTLTIGGVATVPDRHQRYPGGVVSFAFDDSHKSHATVAAPYLARKGFAATSYLINSRIGSGSTWMSFDDLHKLQDAYGWEIGAHASTNDAHIDWTTQTDEWVRAELEAQSAWQEEHGFPARSFAYPIGPFTSENARAASVWYESARSTYGWTNSPRNPHEYRLSCNVINAASTAAGYQSTLDRIVAHGGWSIVMFHDIVESGATGNDTNRAVFEQIVDAVAASGLTVATVADVIA